LFIDVKAPAALFLLWVLPLAAMAAPGGPGPKAQSSRMPPKAQSSRTPPKAKKPSQENAAPPRAELKAVPTIDGAGLKKLLEESRGKVLVLNFWATWCRPCLREFPVLAQAARRYEKKGVKVVAISMDAPQAAQKVRAFSAPHEGSMQILQGGHGREAEFIALTEPAWTGSLPATVFYDKSGARAFTHVGALDEKALGGAIESLLEESEKR
jgi:thiol-disulfide isomerase/thioredoxin